MKGGDPGFLVETLTEEGCGPLLHFASGFVGKGDAEDFVSRGAVADEFCGALGDDASFACTGAGEHEQRAVASGDCRPLRFVQMSELG